MPHVEIDPDPRRTVSGGVLRLHNVELGDTAVYQCKASNKHGTILTNTHVMVIGEGASLYYIKTVYETGCSI